MSFGEGNLHDTVLDMEEELARLRERIASLEKLIADMWRGMCGYGRDCLTCDRYNGKTRDCEFRTRMREMGVEP